jgi:tetratricopeptide (TPR) repeat protein
MRGRGIQTVLLSGLLFFWAAPSGFSQSAPTKSNSSKQQEIEAHTRQAQEFLRASRPDDAVREFNTILQLDPNNVDARGNLGVTLYFKGDYTKAVPQLRAALKSRPNLWKIQALLGMSEKRSGQIALALVDLEKAFPQVQEEKLRIQVGMELIEIYYSASQLEKAAAVAGALRQIAPENTDILYTAYRIYSDLAGESMLTMAMAAPKSARMHQMMAQQMARQGNTEGAIAHYREAVKLDPHTPGLLFELAEALNLSTSAGDQEQVEKAYRAALAENPLDGRAETRLGDIALRGSDLETALQHYKRALELQPNDAEACLGIGRTLVQMHRAAEAESYLKRSIELEPFTAAAHYRLSLVYRAEGRTSDAQKELAEFQRLKDMKERLKQVYQEMRLQAPKQEKLDSEK